MASDSEVGGGMIMYVRQGTRGAAAARRGEAASGGIGGRGI